MVWQIVSGRGRAADARKIKETKGETVQRR
jgi:hypothetical protein